MADALPDHIEAAIAGPIDETTVAILRAHYTNDDPIDASQADELFLISGSVGDRATPQLESFLEEALARFLVADFNPLRNPPQE